MSHSPGHQKWPEHRVMEEHPHSHIQVIFGGVKIAESMSPIKVIEDKHPVRYYVPREDVNMDFLQRTQTTSECPFKGTANYYSIKVGDSEANDAVWTYEDPYDEHRDLKDKLAFYDDNVEQLDVNVS